MMRFSFVFFLSFFQLFAQQQYRTSDFGYSNDVVKVEECLYKFITESKQFVLENQYTTEIADSYFKKQVLSSFFGEKKVVGEYNYIYDSNFSLQEIDYQPVDGQFGYPMKFLFLYEKGKLSQVVSEGISKTYYSYDADGNLIKEIQKDNGNEVVQTVLYQEYQTKKDYVKLKKDGDGTGNDYTKEFYENGLLKRREFVSGDFKSETIYTYDKLNNIVSQVYDDASRIDFGYDLDAKNNRIKIAKMSRAMPEDNSFTFVKITYKDGTISGTTALDLNFVKKYDVVFRTKDSLLSTYKKIKYSKKSYLNILKGEEQTIEILDEFENEYEKVTSHLETTDKKSLIVYNEVDGTTHFLKNFYTEDYPKHIWKETKQILSETGLFWIKNDKFQIAFYQAGNYLDNSNFSIEEEENSNHLLVKTNEGKQFLIKNVNNLEVGILYPLFKK